MPDRADDIAQALRDTLISVNEPDSNMEPANVVDAIVKAGRLIAFTIGRADDKTADRETLVGGLNRIADAIFRLAEVMEGRE